MWQYNLCLHKLEETRSKLILRVLPEQQYFHNSQYDLLQLELQLATQQHQHVPHKTSLLFECTILQLCRYLFEVCATRYSDVVYAH